MKGGAWVVTAAAALLAIAPRGAAGQVGMDGSLGSRVAAVENGMVRFSYATRPEVEICDQGIRMGDRHMSWRSRGHDDEPRNCRVGLAEVEVEVRGGLVRDIEVVRSVDERSSGVVDMGEIGAREASSYLLSLAYTGATTDGAEEAVFPAMLADVDDVWRELLDIARDRAVHESVRKNALFWLGQEAAAAAGEGLVEVALDSDEEQEVRDSAIFSLSQRPAHESVPVLMEVARSGEQVETRRTAMFWLAQSDDERVVAFFEELLLGRIR